MTRHAHRFLLAAIVALIAVSPLASPAAATPGHAVTIPLLKPGKADAKAEAQAKKEAAEATKFWAKCEAKGTCTVTLSWDPGPFNPSKEACVARVSVTGFAPGSYAIEFGPSARAPWSLAVGPDGTGSTLTWNTVASTWVAFDEGNTPWTAIVNGIPSAPTSVRCHPLPA